MATLARWFKRSVFIALILFVIFAIIQCRKDIDELGWHGAFGEYYEIQ